MEQSMMPIEQIQEWIEDKPVWWRHCVRLALNSREFDQYLLDEIYQVAQIEHQLAELTDEFHSAAQPIDFSGHTIEISRVNLSSLSNVAGVGVLAENQTLNFAPTGLCVVYGDNGAGKSSYAEILKSACLTRGSDPIILGNVFEANNPDPSAEIAINVDDISETYIWSRANPSSNSLKSIRVFDTSSAQHYVNKEDALGFKPGGLNLLSELTKVIDYVKRNVEEDIMPGNGFMPLQQLSSDSPVARFVNSLSAKSDERKFTALLATKEEVDRIEPLRQEIAQDKLQTPETIKAKLIQQKELLNPLGKLASTALKYLGEKAFNRVKELKADFTQKQQNADNLKLATLQGLPLETVTGIHWQSLWEAARHFIEQEPNSANFPPISGDDCPLCLQVISVASGERLAALYKFLGDNAATEAQKAYVSLQNAIKIISSKQLSLEDHKAALTEIDKIQPGLPAGFTKLFNEMSERQNQFIVLSKIPVEDDLLDVSPVETLLNIVKNITEQIEAVKLDDGLIALIQRKQQELQLLEDKKFVADNLDALTNNIRRYKVIDKMKAIKKECNPRNISILSSKIYQQGVIEPLKNAFTDELLKFGFTRFSIDVQTRNSGGIQQFKLAIANAGETAVAKVASEGEQRCVAIAAFLAEMNADHRRSAVIFDDPVNSLSHRWSSKVAERLVAESHSRQVIIFTHDIVFFKLLLEQSELQNAQHNSVALERSRKFAGLVRESAPWEALTTSKRLKVLNSKLQELKTIDRNGTESEFREYSRSFYGLLRESWERLVEEKLLNKVVSRFERGVHTQRLSRLVDISIGDIARVDNAMSKCSTYFTGHDSAPAAGNPYPTIDDIVADLEDVNQFLSELQGPRKRS
jgi:energy-coupling factor transporter ATP-binding protein EcfA2